MIKILQKSWPTPQLGKRCHLKKRLALREENVRLKRTLVTLVMVARMRSRKDAGSPCG